MTVKAIIWDIGGVLVRTIDREPRTDLAARYGRTYETLENLVFGGEEGRLAQLGEVTFRQHRNWICDQLGIPHQAGSQFIEEFFAGDRLDETLLAFIRQLHRQYKSGIISNGFDNVRSQIHNLWNMADAFDHIVISGEIGLLKPDPRIFELAVSGLNIKPEEGIFVDDMPRNIEGAHTFGLQAVQFKSTQQVIAEIKQHCTK